MAPPGGAVQRSGLCRPLRSRPLGCRPLGCSEQPPGLQLGPRRGHVRPDGAEGQRPGGLRMQGDLRGASPAPATQRGGLPAGPPTPPPCHSGPTTATGPRREALGFDQEAPSARGGVTWQAGKGPLLRSATRSGPRAQSPSEAPATRGQLTRRPRCRPHLGQGGDPSPPAPGTAHGSRWVPQATQEETQLACRVLGRLRTLTPMAESPPSRLGGCCRLGQTVPSPWSPAVGLSRPLRAPRPRSGP